METLTLLQSLEAAGAIVRTARIASSGGSHTIWKQIDHVAEYIDGQVAELLLTLKSAEQAVDDSLPVDGVHPAGCACWLCELFTTSDK